jgi:hypothetical protein
MARVAATGSDLRELHQHGFWYRPSGNSPYFGTSVVTRDHVAGLAATGPADYLGEVDACQHLYAIRSRQGLPDPSGTVADTGAGTVAGTGGCA